MLRVVPLLVAFLVLLLARSAAAAETVDLLTIGPSADFPSRFGHSLLCVHPAESDTPEHGRCYDYGVPDREDLAHVVWTAVRGTPSFVPITIGEPQVTAFYKDQGRKIERQRLPLSESEASTLVQSLETDVREKRAFAYHPYHANCATKIRDQIDAASNGRLHAGPTQLPPGGYREYMEEGQSGRLGVLTAMALFLGESNDHVPTAWEAMLLPSVLRDGVAERFGAAPVEVAESFQVVLPTTRILGRVVVFLLATFLVVAVRACARRNRLGLALKIVGGTLGVVAVAIELVSALVTWPEISRNWALLMFLPTDLALPFLRGSRLTMYLKVRIALALGLFGLEVVNVIHQPMLPLAALVLLPMFALLNTVRAVSPAAEPRLSRTSEVIGDA